jgi:glycerate kinase
MRILIAPAAFKHSLSAAGVADAIARGLTRSGLNAELVQIPIADGGNGTLDAFLAAGGERVTLTVEGPQGAPVEAAYGLLDDGQTAVIEMALASGIELSPDNNALTASTYGTGQLMRHALERGAQRMIVGMGGSATTDGGAGCLQALDVVRLLDAAGRDLPRGGGALGDLARIEINTPDPRWNRVKLIIASDVENPAVGEHGAAAVFGPQKGASPEQVRLLDANLRHFFKLTDDLLGVDVSEVRGAGAAGAFSGGLMAYFSGRIESGIDLVLAHNRFEWLLPKAALVVTGEGQMDGQTIHGKGPVGVARIARHYGVPTVAIVGGLNIDDTVLHEAGIHAVLPITPRPMALDEALASAADLIERAALRLGYLLQIRG